MQLGNAFPRKLLYVRKPALGKGFFETKTEIDYLLINLQIGNKRAKGESTSVIKIHENMSSIDSVLPNNARRKAANIIH